MLGAETLDFIELNVGVFRLRNGGAGYPPVGAGQPGGQVGPRSWLSMLLEAAGLRHNFAMCRLPQPDQARFFAEDNRVVPPPHHCLRAARHRRDGYKVTG